jgi:hypothetical protein
VIFTKKKLTPEQEAERDRLEADALARTEEESRRAQERLNAAVEEYKEACTNQIQETVISKNVPWQYKTVYLDLDPQYHSISQPISPDVAELNYWGLRGWEVVGVFPRTYSGTEVHRHKKHPTGGALVDVGKKVDQTVSLSANVIGAHILLRRNCANQEYEWPEDWREVNFEKI